ncbi:MAG: phage tail tape measure protein, partial [Olsenella sp.]
GSVQVKFGVTGDALENLSEQFLEFGENTGTTAADDVETVAQAMGIFNVDASQTGNVLGLLQATSQATGASVTDLMGQVQENGATFQSMGLSLGQSVTLLGSFEQSGYDSTQMLAAMKKAAATYNDEGKDMKTGLADLVTRLQDSSTQAEATSEAYDLFGTRAGTTFVKAAQSGKVNLTDLSDSLDGYASTVSDTFGATEDGVDHAQQALKSLQETGATLGEALSDVMGPTLESVSENVKSFADGLDSMSDGEKQGAAQAVIATTAFLGVVTVGGKLVGSLKGIGEGLGTAATFFAKVGGAANVAEEGISASSVAMGVAKTGGIALATIALAAIVTAAVKAKEHEDELTEATSGLASAQSNAAAKANAQSTATDAANESALDFAASVKNVKNDVDAAIESQAKMTSTISDLFEAADTSNIQLGTYRDTIDNLANKSGLTAQQQADLKTAVDNLNTACGTAYTVVDAENGKIADQSGIVQDDINAIDDLVRAKQISNQVDALSSASKDVYEQQVKDADALAEAKKAQSDAIERYTKSFVDQGYAQDEAARMAVVEAQANQDITSSLNDAQAAYDADTGAMSSYNDQINLLTQAQSAGADSVAYAISQDQAFMSQVTTSGKSVSSLASQMSDLGVTGAQMGQILADPTATDQLVSNYDGSEASIATALATMGIDIDAAAASSKASIADMASSIQSLSDNGSIDLSALGLSAHDLSQRLSDAGVTTQAQTAIANGAFAGMLAQSGGDVDALVTILQGYNSTPIVDKDGNVTVNDTSLTDAQGNLYTWNGSTLVDKDGNAVVDDLSLTDAQGNVVTWNGTELTSKSADATVTGNLDDMLASVKSWNSSTLDDKRGKLTIEERRTSLHPPENASGGIIPSHADGGAINGIVTRRTLTNRGWVGEDGAEAVFSSHADGAIVPLTNSHYVTPFARAVAQQMMAVTSEQAQGARASTPTSITASVDAEALGKIVADEVHSSLAGMGLYVDSKKLVGATASGMNVELARIGARR